ncbi:CpsD/CapB family tyrosine-protein kinase [Oceanobacillus piezotolerans]|uniref:CpsD/CapB family tyrosine-protein kinase n=1 Tax=Oceanobacillus piezotolerans TaxID=2448030 RepID=UPI001FE383AD|nr:CpsD/CapB family tyrosine-protein kinase [Oceanobacillus piezotolerans]
MLSKMLKSKAKKIQLVTYFHADSHISDQFREIRENIRFLRDKNKNAIFLITSPENGEGKSTTAANLAVSMAQQKEKVLLIDANLRAPSLHTIFKVPNQSGLSNLLKGISNIDESIYPTDVHHLDILTSGPEVFNPTEILGGQMMTDLLKELGSMYDVILIDAPSVLKTTETRVLANQCQGVILLLQKGKTEMDKAVKTKRLLDLAHANLIGVILNDK